MRSGTFHQTSSSIYLSLDTLFFLEHAQWCTATTWRIVSLLVQQGERKGWCKDKKRSGQTSVTPNLCANKEATMFPSL